MKSVYSNNFRRDIVDSMRTYVSQDVFVCKLFYFFFFAAFGSLYPLLAIYFKQLGMNATQSGILIGFRPFIEFCSAPFWGGVADRLKKWRQLQLFSIFCWIVFTLAMAFVKPQPVACQGDGNANETAIINTGKDLIRPSYSTVFYERHAVNNAFFALLLIIVIGEFFSAPALTFADSVTLSYLGDDINNYGRQRMFGSLGWALSMFFVGMALDHSTTFPEHPCELQHHKEKNYILCFAVFSVLMTCAFITATQFKFLEQPDSRDMLPSVLLNIKDRFFLKVTSKETTKGYKSIDNDFKCEKPIRKSEMHEPLDTTDSNINENRKQLQISLEAKADMVSDVINSPGAAKMTIPSKSDEPFLGRWIAVLKVLAHIKFISVLFILWFMGFGIGLIFTFLFWYLQDLGGSPTLFGVASVINHMSELLAYFLSSRFIATFGHVYVLYAGLVGNIARFTYISYLKNPWWVLPFECVQGLTHAAVWATTCSYVMNAIPTNLRASGQGILQGLHHGLGRGCGAVFGGMLVYRFGSENIFRAYAGVCFFVLVAFVVLNWYLKRQGILTESSMQHSTLEEEPHLIFDPHGVPSTLTPNLSISKLKQQSDTFSGYGSTQGAHVQTTEDLLQDIAKQELCTEQDKEAEFNPRLEDNVSSENMFAAHARANERNLDQEKEPWGWSDTRDPFKESNRSVHSRNHNINTGYEPKKNDLENSIPLANDLVSSSRQPTSDETPRRRCSLEHTEPSEHKERRRRQSGDIEGIRERQYLTQQDERDTGALRGSSRHFSDELRSDGRHGRESRRQRRHNKNRTPMEGKFEDFDPYPKEKIVFEQLPNIKARVDHHKQSRDQDDY